MMVVLRFCRVPFHKAARGAGLCIGWSEQCGAARGGGGGNPARVASMEGGPGKPPRQGMGGMDCERNSVWIQSWA